MPMLPNEEQLEIKIYLKSVGLSNGKLPMYSVLIDGVVVQTGTATPDADSVFTTEIKTSLINGDHTLAIRLLNKGVRDTKVDSEGKITEDLYLVVEKITIDDIDLGLSLLETGHYILDQKVNFNGSDIDQLPGHKHLTWNGTWSLPFSTPFYLWLLENL